MKKQLKRKRFINPLCCAKCRVNQAAVDDAQKQFSEAKKVAKFWLEEFQRMTREFNHMLWLRSCAELAAELNMSAYEDALAHSKINQSLLLEEIRLSEAWKEGGLLTDRLLIEAKAETERWQRIWYQDFSRLVMERNKLREQVKSFSPWLRRGRFDVVSSRLEGDHA